MKKILLASALVVGFASSSYAQSAQPSLDWNGNYQHPSSNPGMAQFILNRAMDMEFIERGGWNHNTTNNFYNDTKITHGDTNCESGKGKFYGGCATDVEQQTTAVGAQTNIDQSNITKTNTEVNGNGNDVVVDNNQRNSTDDTRSSNSGDTSAENNQTTINN